MKRELREQLGGTQRRWRQAAGECCGTLLGRVSHMPKEQHADVKLQE